MVEIFQYKTVGTEIYEDELGPTIGYDDISTGFMIVPAEFDGFDFENIRSLKLVAQVATIGL